MPNQISRNSSGITVDQVEAILKDCLITIQEEKKSDNEICPSSIANLDSLNIEIFLSEVEDRFVEIYPMIIEAKDLRDNPSLQQFALFLFNKIKKGN